MSSCRHLDR